jgi:hypothetical protein
VVDFEQTICKKSRVIESRQNRVRPLERWSALGGIAYVVLFIVGQLVSEKGQPGFDAAPAKVIAFYSQGSHRDSIALGWLLMLIGFLFFIWFLGALAQAMTRLSLDAFLPRVAVIGGAIYVAMGIAGGSLSTAIKTMSDDTYQHRVYPELIHLASDAGYVIHSGGGVGAAAMMMAAGLAALRGRSLPAWVCWLSIVAGVTAIFSIFFLPWIIIGAWLIVASVLVFVSAPRNQADIHAALPESPSRS